MLVLYRKPEQDIVIGNGLIRVRVLEVRGDRVKIGVEAPREIAISREEPLELAGQPRPSL